MRKEAKGSLIMDTFDYEADFREYRKRLLAEIESRFQQEKEYAIAQQDAEVRVSNQLMKLLKESNLDVDRFRALQEAEMKKLDEYLARVRPPLIEREPNFDDRLREQLALKIATTPTNSAQPHLIGADVIADAERLKAYEGKMGNPYKWLYDANEKFKGKASVSGTPGIGGSVPYQYEWRIWYYVWQPPKKGMYSVQCFTYYHGFYTLISVPLLLWQIPYQHASVWADVELKVGGPKKYFPNYGGYVPMLVDESVDKFLDKGGWGSISAGGPLEGVSSQKIDINYNWSTPIYINVYVKFFANAKGAPTHAEVNFEDGSANYVDSPNVLFTWI
jgi:hypothetical protein